MDMKTESVLFSIIVPAYNSASFIRKCIDSILGQTCSDFELVLVDDGSKDDTLSICNAYAEKDGRVRVIHKENGGHTSARNAGLQIASGRYVLFVDSDDWLAEQTLEACKKEIDLNGADVLIFGIQNSTETKPYSVLISDGHYPVSHLNKTFALNLIIGPDGNFVFPKSLSAKCFKRDIVYSSQMSVPKEILIGEDGAAFVDTMLKAQSVSVIAGDERACYYCLIRSDSVSRTADADAFEKFTVLLIYYHEMLANQAFDYSEQFYRYVVAQLYNAVLYVIRSGGGKEELNAGLSRALTDSVISQGLKKARFGLKGYRLIIKKFILRHRFWGLAKKLDG